MLMNYHEMTMNEPRDSPARRKQYLVICTVMATFFIHAVITSGVLVSVTVEQGTFKGGSLQYKLTRRDYAASMGLCRDIVKDVQNLEDGRPPIDTMADHLYALYLDNPKQVGGLRQRFASGLLSQVTDVTLLGLNEGKETLTLEQQDEVSFETLMPKLFYQQARLPKVKAGVCNFPFTNGFVSALVISYKIIPAMHKFAAEHGVTDPVVLTTCSVEEGMCTHYVPLEQTKPFLLGRPDSKTYTASLPPEKVLDWSRIIKGTKKKFASVFGSSNDDKEDETEL